MLRPQIILSLFVILLQPLQTQAHSSDSVLSNFDSNSRFVNIASRVNVGTADAVLIGGLTIDGNEPKTIIIRAIGPSLGQFGVGGFLPDPEISLMQASTLIAYNNDWQEDERADEIPPELTPSHARESILIRTLTPGSYTAIVRGQGTSSGIALIEIYEFNPSSGQLINLSTRGQVGAGDKVLIGGFVITGDAPKTIGIRGSGPSLAELGIEGTLQNPSLSLMQGTLQLEQNDD